MGTPLFCEGYGHEHKKTFGLVGLVTCYERTKPNKEKQKFPLEKSRKKNSF